MSEHDRWRLSPWLIVLALMVGIFCLSTAAFTSRQTALVFGPLNHLARKAAHFTEYAALFVAVRWALGCCVRKPRTVALAILALLICASGTAHLCLLRGFRRMASAVRAGADGERLGCVVGLERRALWLFRMGRLPEVATQETLGTSNYPNQGG